MAPLRSFLAGVRVLDLSRYVPGPLASLLLADMGAEVVKVESPEGDALQELGPRPEGRPVFYETINAGKVVVQLDLKQQPGKDALLEMVATADVLIEGFRPGVMKRLGLDYGRLRAVNPRLIYCSINGYGASGPMAVAAGHDNNYLALAGVLHRNGIGGPVFFDPPVSDTAGSLFAVIAILGALQGRARTGGGCEIDLALADVAMPLQLLQVAGVGATGHAPGREETYLNNGAAYYRVYRTRDDRHVVLGAVEPKFWRAFCEAAERPEWIARQLEPTPQKTLIPDVTAYFASFTLSECIERFAGADCCFSPVLDLAEALETPHLRQRGLVRRDARGDVQTLFPAVIDGTAPPLRERLRRISAGEARQAFAAATNLMQEAPSD
jgi:crotonobetainyl-CoA:carnitine CoA-transferase CaiB-like acyl-CoA transferase